MKRNKIHALFFGLVTLATLAGCKEEYTPIENRIYISEAITKNVKKVSVNVGEVTQTNFTVRIADKLGQDVHATLIVDESILNEYNKKMSSSYSLLPADKFSFEKDIVIKSQKVTASPTVVTIEPYTAAEGVKYALPIRVVGDGSVEEEKLGTQYLLLLDKPWSQATPYLGKSTGFRSEVYDEAISMDNFTIEFWLWMEDFKATNQAIVTSEAFYIRMGNDNNQITKEQMQINIFGANGMNEKLFFTGYSFQKSTWTHVAMVYNQSKCYYYINGEKVMDIDATGVPYSYKSITFFDTSVNNNHMMGQARLWNRVLTQAEIQENMAGPIAVAPGLVGYWKMDEGKDDIIHDSSGNGRDAKLGTGSNSKPIFEWKTEQCFTKKK